MFVLHCLIRRSQLTHMSVFFQVSYLLGLFRVFVKVVASLQYGKINYDFDYIITAIGHSA